MRDQGWNVPQHSNMGWPRKKHLIYWLLFSSEFLSWEKLSLHNIFPPWFLNPFISLPIMKSDSERLRSYKSKDPRWIPIQALSQSTFSYPWATCPNWSPLQPELTLFLSKWSHHPLGHRAWILGGILDTQFLFLLFYRWKCP